MNTSDVLYKAADVMRERGRCPNDLEDVRGRVCMLGAINVVVTGSAWVWAEPGYGFASSPITSHLEGVIGAEVSHFSNDMCRTADDCAAAFEIAADIAAAEGT